MKAAMKVFLAILRELITGIRHQGLKDKPRQEENVLWVFIPKAKVGDFDWDDYANDKDVWVGFYADKLLEYSQHKKYFEIIFRVGTAFVNPLITSCIYAIFNLTHLKGYQAKAEGDQVVLKVPCGNVVLPKPNVPTLCTTKVNQTVFVDPKYGNDQSGKVEQQLCPFKTINRAIDMIPPDGKTWEIRLATGDYPEVAMVPSNIYLVGQGVSLTRIAGLQINGQGNSGASNLTVDPALNFQMVPPLSINYTSEGPHARITLTNVDLIFNPTLPIPSGEFNVVDIRQTNGVDGDVILKDCNVSANLLQAAFNNSNVSLVRSINTSEGIFSLQLQSSTFRLTAPLRVIGSSLTLLRSTRTNSTDTYCRYINRSLLHENFQQTFFISEGETLKQNHPTIRLELLSQVIPSMHPDYLLWAAYEFNGVGGFIKTSSPDVTIFDINPSKVTMADTLGLLSRIRILGGSFPDQGLPKLDVNNNQITYAGHDREGGSINKGSLATKIRRSSENPNVVPHDQTILVDTTTDVRLYDIPEVSQRQIVKGSILTIKNTLDTPVNVLGSIAGSPTSFEVVYFLAGEYLYGVQTFSNQIFKMVNSGGIVQSIAITPDGKTLYITTGDSIWVVDAHTFKTIGSNIYVGPGPEDIIVDLQGKYVYVAIFGNNTVSIIEVSSNTIIKVINVGTGPGAVAVSNDGTKLFVGYMTNNNIDVYNTIDYTLTGTIVTNEATASMAVTPDGTTLYATSATYPTIVFVIDISNNTITTTIKLDNSEGSDIAIAPNGQYAYVTGNATNNVAVIDISTNTLVEYISTPSSTYGIAITPDSTTAYVTDYNDYTNTANIIDLTTNTVTGTINNLITNPAGVVVSPIAIPIPPSTTSKLAAPRLTSTVPVVQAYVAGGDIYAINTSNNTILNTITAQSFSLVMTPDGTRVYTNNIQDNMPVVSVIDTTTGKIIATISPPGNEPLADIAINPAGTFVYVANVTSQIFVIQVLTNEIIATISNLSGADPIVVSPDNQTVYTGCNQCSVITIIDANTNTVSGSIDIPSNQVISMVITADGKFMYVGYFDHDISYIDLTSNTVVGSVSIFGVYGMALSLSGDLLYVVSYEGVDFPTLSTIRVSDNTTVSTLNIPSIGPIAVTPDGSLAYIGNVVEGAVGMTVVDLITNTVSDTINSPSIANSIAIGNVQAPGYQLQPKESIQLNADDAQFHITMSSIVP